MQRSNFLFGYAQHRTHEADRERLGVGRQAAAVRDHGGGKFPAGVKW